MRQAVYILAVLLPTTFTACTSKVRAVEKHATPLNQTLRVAAAEMVGKLNATGDNLMEACRLSEQAGQQGVRLVLFPEGCLTGNAISDARMQAVLAAEPESFTPLQHIANRYRMTIAIGFVTSCGEKFNVVQAIIRPNQAMLFQHKAARADTEPSFLEPWSDPKREVFEVDGFRVVMMICSEFGAERVVRLMAEAQPDLVLHCSAGRLMPHEVIHEVPPPVEALAAAETSFRGPPEGAAKDAARRGTPRLASNPIGFDGQVYWPGNSYAVGADGKIHLWVKGCAVPSEMRPSVSVVDLPIPVRLRKAP